MPAAVPLQPSCAPATPHTRHVWQPVSPLRRARMGCWARWTQSSARCWARPVSALRALSCTGAAQGSASPRRSAVGSCPPWAGPSPQPRVSFTLLLPMAEAPCIPPGLLWGGQFPREGLAWDSLGLPTFLSPLHPAMPTAACTDGTGVPRALGETWNSSLSGCSQHQCQAPDTIVPVGPGCPDPRPEICPRFGEVALLLPTEDPCCLGTVCGESHPALP